MATPTPHDELWPPEIEEALSALEDRPRAFVLAYVGECALNAAQAAIAAGYAEPSSRTQGWRLKTNEHVRRAIDLILDHIALTPAEVRWHLNQHATANIADVTDEDGLFDRERAEATGAIRWVRKIKVNREDVIDKDGNISLSRTRSEVELEPKQGALDKLARIQGQYKDTVTLQGNPDKPLVTPPTPEQKAESYAELLTILHQMGLGQSGED